ncbi:MAG: tetratricopeptide repeat protein [Paracoccaceae bacterium]
MRFLYRLNPIVLLVGVILTLSACDSAEERAERHYQDALSLIAEGDIDRAIVELRNVFSLDGNRRDARRTMAELQMQRGDRSAAYRQYLRLAEQYPDDLDTRIVLSEMAFLGGNWDEVERHGARAEELDSENARVKVITLLRTYRAATEAAAAAELREMGRLAEDMLAEQRDNALLHNIMVDFAIREQDFERALSEIDWVIANDPQNSRNYQERLRILAQLGDVDAVEAQLRDMVEIFADNPTHTSTLIRFYLTRQDLDSAEGFLRERVAAADPEDIQPTLDLIRFLVELRGADAARLETEKAIANHPNPATFHALAATLDFSEGRQEEAITALEALLADAQPSEESQTIRMSLARMLMATGNEVGARARVEETLAKDDTHPAALKMQAAWQIEADDTDAALSGLRVALDQNAEDAEAMTLMASAFARAGQKELVREYLARAVEVSSNAPAETLRFAQLLIKEGNYLPAEDILLSALRLAPSNIGILVQLGSVYLRMDDFGRAQSVADVLRRIGGETAAEEANKIEANRLTRQQGVDEALTFLEGIANSDDATLATRVTLVQAQISIGDTESAVTLAQELKQEYPDNKSLNIVLAVAHSLNGDLDMATSLYQGLLDTDPVRPSIWLELSRLQQRQGDRETAKSLIDKALTHAPEAANLLWAKASFLEQDGDIDAAIEIYEQLYAQNSNSLVVANNLASLLATYRNDGESLDRAWLIARRLSSAEAPALQDTYGWILHRRGNSADARSYLEKAAEGLPNDPLIQYHLGQVYNALGQTNEALGQLRKAISLAGPADTRPQIETARELLQSLQNADDPKD